MKPQTITSIHLPIRKFKSGKVREMYDLGDSYLMIATDRISAFDRILPNPIPYKGIVLNKISLFWFDMMKKIIPNHILISDFKKFPANLKKFPELKGRAVIVKKAKTIPIECVARGYLSGSGWKEYQETQTVCGIKLPAGLKESGKLPEPIFTPATKEEDGAHDINISFEQAAEIVGRETAEFLREKTLEIYAKASAYAKKRGIIIADTKFEFGFLGKELIIIDEMLTPDSSRFWPLDKYKAGGPQPSFDKQYVRDYLISICWNKEPPIPELPKEVIEGTSKKYIEAYEQLTGKKLV